MYVQYREDAQYREVFNTVGDILSTIGKILSTVEDVQYHGGCHEKCGVLNIRHGTDAIPTHVE